MWLETQFSPEQIQMRQAVDAQYDTAKAHAAIQQIEQQLKAYSQPTGYSQLPPPSPRPEDRTAIAELYRQYSEWLNYLIRFHEERFSRLHTGQDQKQVATLKMKLDDVENHLRRIAA